MARRFNLGSGWIETSREVENAAFELSAEENVSISEAIQSLMTSGEARQQYGLAGNGTEPDED